MSRGLWAGGVGVQEEDKTAWQVASRLLSVKELRQGNASFLVSERTYLTVKDFGDPQSSR